MSVLLQCSAGLRILINNFMIHSLMISVLTIPILHFTKQMIQLRKMKTKTTIGKVVYLIGLLILGYALAIFMMLCFYLLYYLR